MATWDQGGGCACGLNKYCSCGVGQMDGRTAEQAKRDYDNAKPWGAAVDVKLFGHAIKAPTQTDVPYKYGEDNYLQEMNAYIDATYNQHYSKTKFQSTEFIFDAGHGEGFCVGNIMKYAQRYGRKGTEDEWRKDVLKIIHYAMMLLWVNDNRPNATLKEQDKNENQ